MKNILHSVYVNSVLSSTIAIIFLIQSAVLSHAAEFFWDDDKLYLTGNIVPGDSDQLLYSLSSKMSLPQLIVLRSRGGSVSEAILMGKMLRKYRVAVSAPNFLNGEFSCSDRYGDYHTNRGDCSCASACALVWFGGVMRFGSVGLHRSYIISGGSSFNDYEVSLQQSRQHIVSYLNDMRVPNWVVDMVFQTASDDLSIVSAATPRGPFEPWMLHPIYIDPTFQEFALSVCGGEPKVLYENMHCYIKALRAAQIENEDERWNDTVRLYFSAFPELGEVPVFEYFDKQVRDITGSDQYRNEGWLNQLGRAHWRTSQKFGDVEAPKWWSSN